MTLAELAAKFVVPPGTDWESLCETLFVDRKKTKGRNRKVSLETLWRRCVNAALALANKHIETCDDADRETAFLEWNAKKDKRFKRRATAALKWSKEIGRVAEVEKILQKERGFDLVLGVLVAYANILIRTHELPSVQEIGAECGFERSLRHNGGLVSWIARCANLPLQPRGRPQQK
jgi:hypothetical protein